MNTCRPNDEDPPGINHELDKLMEAISFDEMGLPPRKGRVSSVGQTDLTYQIGYNVLLSNAVGVTNDWFCAGHATQGVPGARVRKIRADQGPSIIEDAPSNRPTCVAWAVMRGIQPGVYLDWNSAKAQTDFISGQLVHGYYSEREAHKAFKAAVAKGKVHVCTERTAKWQPNRNASSRMTVPGPVSLPAAISTQAESSNRPTYQPPTPPPSNISATHTSAFQPNCSSPRCIGMSGYIACRFINAS
ncbi:hypothetical protein PILCRDRAFT_9048 [Piloderma croceum F 1598]|uniref:Ribonuclease H1 N-terminal domain-containing protein n=1 Tax=Piloderma croceum (strain F 1598) TaxID=765440 RepID=A0A0C3BUH3_PILCF|nr:hypothetical protein PILCRDRAFT_9048 [Piloderma croceum F 1598]